LPIFLSGKRKLRRKKTKNYTNYLSKGKKVVHRICDIADSDLIDFLFFPHNLCLISFSGRGKAKKDKKGKT